MTSAVPPVGDLGTHAVRNQPPPFAGVDLFTSDRALVEAVEREGGGWGSERLARFGARLGEPQTLSLGEEANRWPPVLRTHDPCGQRIDEVAYHPAWHELMRQAVSERVHSLPWAEPRPGAHVVRAAAFYLLNQVESGVCCPLAMTFAAVALLEGRPEFALWREKALSDVYDPGLRPLAVKQGVLIGMAMTEKQGGSDVRANTTRALPRGDGGYELVGHKWFCSAPMSDAFLTLAYVDDRLTCFLLPRVRPEGTRNAFFIQRLKDKLGNRANASAEVEFERAFAWCVGDEGEGVRTIIKMVHHTRLECALGSAGLMRGALSRALHHAAHRVAFRHRLVDQPLMRNLLADLALESEAACALVLRLARAFDRAADPCERQFARIATGVAKYWICKRAIGAVAEALECLGGNGYVEEHPLARLYREAPVNSIWEGSGNVICLDVLRALARAPEALDALRAELQPARGADRRFDRWTLRLEEELSDPREPEARARRIVERLALALQASLLIRHGPPPVADAFCAARLGEEAGLQLGTLPAGLDLGAICERAQPALA